jgi:subtilisin family serine protease
MRIRSLVVVGVAALLAVVTGPTSASAAPSSVAKNYLVLYKGTQSPASAAADITAAGGTLVANYSQIGVAIARASSDSFRISLAGKSTVDGVVDTSQYAVRLEDDVNLGGNDTTITPPTPAPGNDTLSGLQWDMDQIDAPAARAINGGSRSIVVGDIDTGLDFTHPDLVPNVDFANSASCIGGVPNTAPAAWNDDNGHGTHTAGTIAAAKNGIGIVGVAPNVKIAGIKAGDALGFFFPEAVICAFVWAGTHNINVTNNSYFADPWLFNCKNDAEQRAIWKAERRAIDFAQKNKVLVVSAMGNQADDLAHPTADATSPDDTNPVVRQIHNDCAVVPVEVAGVVGVTASGNTGQKSFYSSYGVGTADVMAPGGDSLLGTAPNLRVLSTYPAALMGSCARKVIDPSGATYCYLQGTSMASPHVAGVAALIESRGITNPGTVTAKLQNTADPVACPADLSVYDFFPALDNGAPQVCQGGTASNSFAGKGQVNALTAVS